MAPNNCLPYSFRFSPSRLLQQLQQTKNKACSDYSYNPITREYHGVEKNANIIKAAMLESSFFMNVGKEHIDKLFSYFKLCSFSEGSDPMVPLLRHGEDQDFAGIIIEGSLTVVSEDNLPKYTLSKDDTLGETLVATSRQGQNPFSVYVRRPGKVLITTISELEKLSSEDPMVYSKIIDAFVLQCIKLSVEEPNYEPVIGGKHEKNLVAIVAHDAKKNQLQDFVVKHQGTLRNCKLTGTATTCSMLFEKANLSSSYKVPSGPLGGDLSIGALIANGCIDVVFFFKDPMAIQCHYADIEALCELCDVTNTPCGTNIATSKLIMKYLNDREHHHRGTIESNREQIEVRNDGIETCPKLRRRSSVIKKTELTDEDTWLINDLPSGSDDSEDPLITASHENDNEMTSSEKNLAVVEMEVEDLASELKKLEIMSRFNDNELELVAEMITVLDLHRGDYLFRYDKESKCAYIVLHGRLEIIPETAEEQSMLLKDQTYKSISKGEIYGISSLVLNQETTSWNVSALAARKTRVAVLPRHELMRLKNHNNKMYHRFHLWHGSTILKERQNNNITDSDIAIKYIIITCDETKIAMTSLKELITKHKEFFKERQHQLIGTKNIISGLKSLEEIEFKHSVEAPLFGGASQLGDLVCRCRVKAAIVLRDRTHMERRFESLLRVADLYAVPVATNRATADILIHYFED